MKIYRTPLAQTLLILGLLLPACEQVEQATPRPVFVGLFIPDASRNIQQSERQGVQEASYDISAEYPASPFLCELISYLDQHHWRPLIEDASNPGSLSGLIRGWSDHGDSTRQPAAHVHVWMSQWLNQEGDLLTYGLRYDYPEGSHPALSTLQVTALLWPAAFVRSQLGPRAEELRALLLPAPPREASDSPKGQCVQPRWSEFVALKSVGAAPVRGLPYELDAVHSIFIESDTDGLAARIAQDLKARVPNLTVSTVNDPPLESSDAILDFTSECRCNEPGLPNGFYVREALLYRGGVQKAWAEPARVLFHWTDSGDPVWRKQLPRDCIGQRSLGASCKAWLNQADIAFTAALASALIDARSRR